MVQNLTEKWGRVSSIIVIILVRKRSILKDLSSLL